MRSSPVSRRSFLRLAGTTVGVGLLAACAPQAAPPAATSAPAAAKPTEAAAAKPGAAPAADEPTEWVVGVTQEAVALDSNTGAVTSLQSVNAFRVFGFESFSVQVEEVYHLEGSSGSNPDLTECSSPSVQRKASDQLAACTVARLPAT